MSLVSRRKGSKKDYWTGRDFAELAEVLAGRRPGRADDKEITVFKSLGLAIEDIAAAAHIVRAADDQGLGIEVSL